MKELGWLQQLIGVRSLSEEDKTHNQMVNSSPRSKFLNKLVISDGIWGVSSWMNWLLLMVFFLVLQWIFLNVFPQYLFDPLLLEVLLCYIVLLYSIPPSTYLLSSLVLEFLSPFPQLFWFSGNKSGWKHCSEVFSTLMRPGKLL